MIDLILFLKSLRVFGELSLDDLERLIEGAELISVDRGQRIFAAGSPIEEIYVVRNGSIALSIDTVVIDTVSVGGILGEQAMFQETTHPGSAVARERCELLRLPVSILRDLAAETPEMLHCWAAESAQKICRLQAQLAEALRRGGAGHPSPCGTPRTETAASDVSPRDLSNEMELEPAI